MRLKNNTDIPTERIRGIIRFVRPSGISRFDVGISNIGRGHAAGSAYAQGCGVHSTADPFIVCRVGGEYPWVWKAPGPGYLDIGWIASIEESLVALLAHELRHLWQATHKRGRVWGSRGVMSERDADAYAINRLRAWRKAQC